MTDSKGITVGDDFQTRLAAFVQLVQEHLTRECKLPNVKIELGGGGETALIQYTSDKPKTGLRSFACVECSTGNIHKPFLGGIYRHGDDPGIFGSIYDADLGKSCLDTSPPGVRRSPSRAGPAKDAVMDPEPYLGAVFFSLHRVPRALRVIGWTKSKKSVIIELVKCICADENIHLDHKWLASNPVTKPAYAPGMTKAILKDNAKYGPYVIYEGISHTRVGNPDLPLLGGAQQQRE